MGSNQMKLSTGKTTIPGFPVTSSPPFKNALTEEFYLSSVVCGIQHGRHALLVSRSRIGCMSSMLLYRDCLAPLLIEQEIPFRQWLLTKNLNVHNFAQ